MGGLVKGLLCLAILSLSRANNSTLPVAVLLPESGAQEVEGKQYRYVAEAALAYVNNQSWMVGQLNVTFHDTKSTAFDAWQAAEGAFKGNAATPAALVGPSYSSAALAASVSARAQAVPMLLFDATNPGLSRQPFVLRTCATDALYSQALVATLAEFEWAQFGVVYSATDYGRGFKEQLALTVSKANGGGTGGSLRMAVAAEFDSSAGHAQEELLLALEAIRSANLRIITLLCHPADAVKVMELAAARGMTGKGWLWIGPEWSTMELLQLDASPKLRAALGGMLGLVPDNGNAELRRVLGAASSAAWNVSAAGAGALFDAMWLLGDVHSANQSAVGAGLYTELLRGGTRARPSPVFERPIALDTVTKARSNQALQLVNFQGEGFVTVAAFQMGGKLVLGAGGAGAIVWPGEQGAPPSDRGSASISESAVYFFFVLLGLIGTYVADALLHEYQVYALPSSGATILVGIVIGGIVKAIGSASMIAAAKFDEQLFTLILLPIIVFESGYAMRRTYFFSQLGSILTCVRQRPVPFPPLLLPTHPSHLRPHTPLTILPTQRNHTIPPSQLCRVRHAHFNAPRRARAARRLDGGAGLCAPH